MPPNLSNIVFNLKSQTELQKGAKNWNTSEVERKFSFEREWIKAVRRARGRPNYGMGNINHRLDAKKSQITSTLSSMGTVEKVFSPSRFEGQDVLRKRHFSRVAGLRRKIEFL